uniref:Uncharacterized protein n=1 Tax=Rhodococcus sp. Mel TaxID=1093626 RepID=H8ZKU0_9NOCA|nr:hypothetical protein [Rhodococcus sp. Mel]
MPPPRPCSSSTPSTRSTDDDLGAVADELTEHLLQLGPEVRVQRRLITAEPTALEGN